MILLLMLNILQEQHYTKSLLYPQKSMMAVQLCYGGASLLPIYIQRYIEQQVAFVYERNDTLNKYVSI